VIGMKVGKENLVELVDRQLQAGVVRQGAASKVEDQEVAFGVADLDEYAGRGLGARNPRIAASQYRHPHLTGLELLLARDVHLGVSPPRGADHRGQGDRFRSAGKRRHRQGCQVFGHDNASSSIFTILLEVSGLG
jgi:hypothetical protein